VALPLVLVARLVALAVPIRVTRVKSLHRAFRRRTLHNIVHQADLSKYIEDRPRFPLAARPL